MVDSATTKYKQEISVIIRRPKQRGRRKGISTLQKSVEGFVPTLFQEMHKPFSDLGIIHDKTSKESSLSPIISEAGVLCTGEEIELSPQPLED
jgi:hypothetical protein